MERVIVTAGAPYIDIDAYAGCVAYAELLRLQGHNALAVSTAPRNESITSHLAGITEQFTEAYEPDEHDTYALIDVSDPAFFDTFVDNNRGKTVIDHHTGFEEYWKDRIGAGSHIEFIGSACTIVFEEWQRAGKLEKMRQSSAELLCAGIIDNTLNFGAKITTERDRSAFRRLFELARLDANWVERYLTECQQAIEGNVRKAVAGDSKVLHFRGLEKPVALGQLVLWDARGFVQREAAIIQDELSALEPSWAMNLISLKDKTSIIISESDTVRTWLSALLGITFTASVARADRLWLRKEIIKADQKQQY